MNNIVDYIKERIEYLKYRRSSANTGERYDFYTGMICELNLVLSKIEELGK